MEPKGRGREREKTSDSIKGERKVRMGKKEEKRDKEGGTQTSTEESEA